MHTGNKTTLQSRLLEALRDEEQLLASAAKQPEGNPPAQASSPHPASSTNQVIAADDQFKYREDLQQARKVLNKAHRVVSRLLPLVLQQLPLSEQLALAELIHVFGDSIIDMPAPGQPILGELLQDIGGGIGQLAKTEAAHGEASNAQPSVRVPIASLLDIIQQVDDLQ